MNELKPGHVIHTLKEEHVQILFFLDALEALNNSFQKASDWASQEDVNKLVDIAEHLVGADPHHLREERVLFPEMEKNGILGPTAAMRQEHDLLRAKKKELQELARNACGETKKVGFDVFRIRLAELSGFIVATLREHIFKENEILYPMALQAISPEETWQKMKKECDKIGYCCFTPSS